MSSETSLLLPGALGSNLKIYHRRWYILILFALLNFTQCAVWNTWGPISSSALAAYPSWSEATIAMLSNWGTLMYITFSIPVALLYAARGLRSAVLVAASLISSGTVLRCIYSQESFFTWTAHIGALLNGIAGIVVCSVPPALAALWFPVTERTTAIGIATLFNQLGYAGSFLVGLRAVREPVYSGGNCTNAKEIRNDIENLMGIEAAVSCCLLALILLYFPSKPPLPPTPTSAVKRIRTSGAMYRIRRNKNVWFLSGAYSLSQGVVGIWFSVITMNLEPLGISQAESGWLGTWSLVGGCLTSLVVARFTDALTGYMKKTLIVLLATGALALTWLMFMCFQWITFSPLGLWFAVIIGSSANYATTPLFFQLCSEVAFPVDEALIGGIMTCLCNAVGASFLFVFFIPGIGVSWVNYCLVLGPLLGIPLVVFTKEEYRRRDQENRSIDDSTTPPEVN